MQSYKQFLNEAEDLAIDNVDSASLMNHIDHINDALDEVLEEKDFVNSVVFFNTVRGTVERFGIVIPAGYEMPMLSLESETVYALADTGYYLYICHSTEENKVEGYATIVDETDLNDLLAMKEEDDSEEEDDGEDMPMSSAYLRQTRRTNDDSGNSDEYA